MAEDSSSVRLNVRTGEVEVTGSEQFIERVMAKVPALFESFATLPPPPPGTGDGREGADGQNRLSETSSLNEFIAAKKLTKNSSKDDITTAFVYFLTKVKKQEFASNEEIEDCYEAAGFPKPAQIPAQVAELRRPDRKGYLASAGRGRTILTVGGENYVVGLG